MKNLIKKIFCRETKQTTEDYIKSFKKIIGDKWHPYTDDGKVLYKRTYPDFETYLAHQKIKLNILQKFQPDWLKNYDVKLSNVLKDRLVSLPLELKGKSVLCLGARLGTEVRVFLNLGAFAVGVDINPGEQNKYVLHGDFHHLEFPDASVDIVYTNALDHIFEIRAFAVEVNRVLKPRGHFIVEAVEGHDKRENLGFHESFWWKNISDLIVIFEQSGFSVFHKQPIVKPWPGKQLVLQKNE